MPFDCRHRQRFGPEACLSSCPAAPPVFQVVRVQRAADVPAPEPNLVDIAVLDMHHGWPNLGHGRTASPPSLVPQSIWVRERWTPPASLLF